MKHLFDLSYLHSLSGDPSFVPQMIQTFLNIVPSQVNSLNEAVEKDDANLSALVLHKLKPSMQAFGCNSLIPEIIELEQLAKTDHSPYTHIDRYHQLIQNINQCITSLMQYQEQGF